MDISSGRDRSRPLIIPRAPRPQYRYCRYCGASIRAEDHSERYQNRVYCSSRCHKEGRKADAAENRKRRRMRLSAVPTPARAKPEIYTCTVCKRDLPAAEFTTDRSRKSCRKNTCVACNRERCKRWYEANRDQHKHRQSANRKSASTHTSHTNVPDGLDMSPRQYVQVVDNLHSILRELPQDAPAVLLESLQHGRINGQLFEDRQGCGCLWGTLGRAYGWSIAEEGEMASRHRKRLCAEVNLFGRIAPGDTPQSNPYATACQMIIIEFAAKIDGK